MNTLQLPKPIPRTGAIAPSSTDLLYRLNIARINFILVIQEDIIPLKNALQVNGLEKEYNDLLASLEATDGKLNILQREATRNRFNKW